jgi:uncharacterized protein
VSVLVLYLAVGIATVGLTAAQLPQSQQSEPARSSKLSHEQISQLQARAEAGDASAQALLGKAYEDGDGVPKSDQKAFQWYRRAAEQGHAESQNKVGILYSQGYGVDRSKEEAVVWYLKAARQKNGKALFNLGAAYYNGDGVRIDDVESYAWFLLAKDAGNPAADDAVKRAASENPRQLSSIFTKIAEMYKRGDELPKDSAEALRWYRKAADAGDSKASVTVASMLLSPDRKPTTQEGAESRRRCEEAAERNFPPGAYCMVLIYRLGLGGPKDPVEWAKWLNRAADLGHPQAALELGEAHWKGDGVQKDLVTAYMWIWLAFRAKVQGAETDAQALQKEMSPKQMEQAKRKASEWVMRHRLPTIYERGAIQPQH